MEPLPHGNRLRTWGHYLLVGLLLTGCTATKKAAIVATAAGTGALAGTVLSGGIAAPIVGATTTAFVTDMVTEITETSPTNMECAPTNFFDLLEAVVVQLSWWGLLLIGLPIVLGWILPGPLERKKK